MASRDASAPGPGLRLARVLLLGVGAGLAANTIWLVFTANLTIGTALEGLVALALLAWGIWLPRVRQQRWLAVVAGFLCAGILALSGFLAYYGSQDDVGYDEEAVIVLGAAVHGTELSRTLQGRLDEVVAYHQRNPQALIVVSGGQGPQEDVPEAVAMRTYLLGRGIASELILVEDRSTSTQENFTNSRAVLGSRIGADATVAFITDEFHTFRATQLASRTGLRATHLASSTPWYFWPSNYLRENVMVLKWWLTGS